MARKIAENLPEGYLTRWIRGGKTFGELLLAPTVIYVPLVDDCQKVGIDLHYAVHITGHGWRKLMRAKESFTYVITNLPTKTMSPVFDFIQENGNVTDEEMYGTYNMGAGFALYVPKSEVPRIFDLCAAGDYREKYGIEVSIGGYIEKGQDKKVVIQPKNLTFEADTLAVR